MKKLIIEFCNQCYRCKYIRSEDGTTEVKCSENNKKICELNISSDWDAIPIPEWCLLDEVKTRGRKKKEIKQFTIVKSIESIKPEIEIEDKSFVVPLQEAEYLLSKMKLGIKYLYFDTFDIKWKEYIYDGRKIFENPKDLMILIRKGIIRPVIKTR